jgi:hypothetical protein
MLRLQLSPLVRFVVEYGLVVIPVTAAMTIGNEVAGAITVVLVVSAMIVASAADEKSGRRILSAEAAAPYAGWTYSSGRPPFLTHLRAGVFLLTVVAILAVDFPLFPRVLGKTEVAGYSLMDIGVGAVVLTGAIASKQSRAVTSSNVLRVAGSSRSENRAEAARQYGSILGEALATLVGLGGAVQQSLVAVGPLVVLGLGKLIVTALVNYQNHVTEYGRHWNFFITLALVPLLAALAEALCMLMGASLSLPDSLQTFAADDDEEAEESASTSRAKQRQQNVFSLATALANVRQPRSALQAGAQWFGDALPLVFCGVCLSFAHQWWLSFGGFAWIVSAHRAGDGLGEDQWRMTTTLEGLVDANREGVFGVIGFTAIALIGVGIGRGIFLPIARHRLLHLGEQHRRAALGVSSAAGPDGEGREHEDIAEERFALSASASWGIVAAMALLSASLGVLHALMAVFVASTSDIPGARGFSALSPSRRTVNTEYVLFTCSAMTGVLAVLMMIHLTVAPVAAIARRVRQSTASGAVKAMRDKTAEAGTQQTEQSEDADETRDELNDSELLTPASRGRGRSSSTKRPRPTAPKRSVGPATEDQPGQGGGDRLGPWLPLLDATNRHPLTLFLVANVLTGTINTVLGDATSVMPDGWALCVLAVYTVVCCGLVFELDRVGVVVRLL